LSAFLLTVSSHLPLWRSAALITMRGRGVRVPSLASSNNTILREGGPSAANATPQTSLDFDRSDDSLEVETCTPAGFGDCLRRGGFVRHETGLVAGNEDDPQEAQHVAVARDGDVLRFLRIIFVPSDETCFVAYEAATSEAVAEAGRRAGLDFERIVAAVEVK